MLNLQAGVERRTALEIHKKKSQNSRREFKDSVRQNCELNPGDLKNERLK